MELNEKKITQILRKQREEYQRYLGATAEEFALQVKMVAEILSDVKEQLQELKDLSTQNTEDLGVIKMEAGIIRSDLKEKVSRDEFKVLEKRVISVERKLQKIS